MKATHHMPSAVPSAGWRIKSTTTAPMMNMKVGTNCIMTLSKRVSYARENFVTRCVSEPAKFDMKKLYEWFMRYENASENRFSMMRASRYMLLNSCTRRAAHSKNHMSATRASVATSAFTTSGLGAFAASVLKKVRKKRGAAKFAAWRAALEKNTIATR